MSNARSDPTIDPAQLLDHLQQPILVIDRELRVLYANKAAREAYGEHVTRDGRPRKCHELSHDSKTRCDEAGLTCPVREVFEGGQRSRTVHRHVHKVHGARWEEIIATPLCLEEDGTTTCVIEEIRDATETLKTEEVLAELRAELRTLRDLLPICASCKQVRQTDGSWHPIEHHLKEHAQVDFTHGLCPLCVNKLYPKHDGGGL